MKAVLTEERFSDSGWIFERKLDGIRCIAIKADTRVRLLSRNHLSLNARFPEVAEALERDPATQLVIDGEIVAFAGGRSTFEALQQRGERPVRIFYYVFDLLHRGGRDVTTLRDLGEQLAALRREDSPFADEVRERNVTWVEPRLVAQIGFSEWTRDGRLRHPRFLGRRDDKAPEEVVRE